MKAKLSQSFNFIVCAEIKKKKATMQLKKVEIMEG